MPVEAPVMSMVFMEISLIAIQAGAGTGRGCAGTAMWIAAAFGKARTASL